ncbi:DctP family TRAP transporter solute-binding subunit [Salipiger sp. P9]|uniref:DctP family TRAP transporter solute-binding subunit n=1 Tax=Salipiger pentaromativorans TaxID=2943193 RepID=UPI002157DF9E|nr:DctP family TRAP transporter solute-binding subunit [Salipiger pentaromativorans]MCR8551012.1 DctP family TRAP transporter solute-binding subunit [Salipiger pentaromativorans]
MTFIRSGLAALTAMSIGCSAAFAAPITIKFAHVVAASGHPKGEAVAYFKQLVDERLAGKVALEVYPSGSLYGDDKVLEAMQLGDVQMAAPSLAKFERFTKAFQIFDLPFLFRDTAHAEAFQASDAGRSILSEMEKAGFVGLDYWSLGMKQLSANRPLVSPDDAKGLKFRVQPADIIEAQMKALGANPQVLAYAEAYNALQSGVVDGAENPWANIWSAKFYEVQDGITETNHGAMGYVLVTSSEFWDGLPDDIRAELRAIIDEVTLRERDLAASMNAGARDKIAAAGSTIRELTPDQRQAWVTAMKPVWDAFEDEIGADLIAAASAASPE